MIAFVVALPSEAAPLVEAFHMRREESEPLPLFRAAETVLVVSGVGKAAAAAATGFVQGRIAEAGVLGWINVGVAGHGELPLGEAVIAHKVTDEIGGRSSYPPLLFARPCRSVEVLTVERCERDYARDVAYDMEASSFVAAASRFSTAELVQVVKVISDNRDSPPDAVGRRRVQGWIEAQIGVVNRVTEGLAESLTELDRGRVAGSEVDRFLSRWHFTVTERRRLERQLCRWKAVGAGEALWCESWEVVPRGKDVLRLVESRISEKALASPLVATPR